MFTFAGIKIFSGTPKKITSLIDAYIMNRQHEYICFLGAHGCVEANNDTRVKTAFQKAGLVVPDGMSMVWIGKLTNQKKTERIYGPDTMLSVCALAEEKNYKIFLYGTTEHTLQLLKIRLKELYPKLHICGVYSPPFGTPTAKETSVIQKYINNSGAHIIFVGLSTPRQELWMCENTKKLNANVLLGVGAAFDFIAATKRQAPSFMRSVGLEWVYRLYQEPKRLWYRYTVMNMMFFSICIRYFLKFKHET